MKTFVVEIDGIAVSVSQDVDGKFIVPDGWRGVGTALKPAVEPIVLARKPLVGTVAANLIKHGCGALNIDVSRIGIDSIERSLIDSRSGAGRAGEGWGSVGNQPEGHIFKSHADGRWPANVIHDGSDEVEAAFAELGDRSGGAPSKTGSQTTKNTYEGTYAERSQVYHSDTGSASRFFYTAKADAADRAGSKHPTVKPTDLMRYLVQMVTPKGGTVLDPFAGTGSTGLAADQIGCSAVLIEQDAGYAADIHRKITSDAPLFAEVAVA